MQGVAKVRTPPFLMGLGAMLSMRLWSEMMPLKQVTDREPINTIAHRPHDVIFKFYLSIDDTFRPIFGDVFAVGGGVN